MKTTVHDERELNILGLDTFLFDKENVLDFSIDKVIQNLKTESKKIHGELASLSDLYINNPEGYEDLDEKYQNIGGSLREHEYNHIQDLQYIEDEAFALLEVKIIYAYKHFEINFKKVLSVAYKDLSAKKLYAWRDFSQFLLTKEIDVKSIECFSEIDQLREVNNALKHAGEITNDFIKKIPEFKDKVVFNTYDLEDFYKRVKDAPKKFLLSVQSKIANDLYKFDDERLEKMAYSLALRMNEEVVKKFCKKLLTHYK